MSKSKGNLVFVSKLVADGRDPMAIRWALMQSHYRSDRMWTEDLLITAEKEISALRKALKQQEVAPTQVLIQHIVESLANDLDTQSLIQAVNTWVNQTNAGVTGGDPESLIAVLDALIGIKV
jgi:L-cysteine:1D-myo-inositol 2-amino-2-deoxy-alpha-D-glucopyranoside ligase